MLRLSGDETLWIRVGTYVVNMKIKMPTKMTMVSAY